MTTADQPNPNPSPSPSPRGLTPTSFLAAAALNTIHEALRTARTSDDGQRPEPEPAGSQQALAALLLLREVRDQLAEWEPGLIEEARHAGASWADLAHPRRVQPTGRRTPLPARTSRKPGFHGRRAGAGHPRPPRRRPHRHHLGSRQRRGPAPARGPDHRARRPSRSRPHPARRTHRRPRRRRRRRPRRTPDGHAHASGVRAPRPRGARGRRRPPRRPTPPTQR